VRPILMTRFVSAVLVVLAVGSMLIASVLASHNGSPTQFNGTVNRPVGVWSRFDRLFATRLCQTSTSQPRELLAFTEPGVQSAIARLLDHIGCFEEYGAVAPRLGTYTASSVAEHVFVVQGKDIVILEDGVPAFGYPSSVRKFARIPSLGESRNGITFDLYGAFGNDMIVVGTNTSGQGEVWRVRAEFSNFGLCGPTFTAADLPCGVATMVGAPLPGVPLGGPPTVVPRTFGPLFTGDLVDSFGLFPSRILVTSQTFGGGTVFAVGTGGFVDPDPAPPADIDPIAAHPAASGVHFIPPAPVAFGGGAFFVTRFANNGRIFKYPPGDFTGPGHDARAALVTSNGAGIALLKPSPPLPIPLATLPIFHATNDDQRGADFTGRHWERIVIRPTSETGQGRGWSVTILSRPGFSPQLRVICATLRFGRRGNEPSVRFCTGANTDLNDDGIPDLTFHADGPVAGIGPGIPGFVTGELVPASPGEGFEGGQ